MPNTIQSVSLVSCGAGIGLAGGSAGSSQSPVLCVKSLVAGDGILITANSSRTDVTISATGMPPLTSLITASAHWSGSNATPQILPIFIAAFPVVVTAILARVEQVSASPGTLQVVKAASGIPLSQGTSLVTTPFDVTSTPTQTHWLGLTNNITVLVLEPGDSLGMTTTGNWSNAYGGLTVHMAPWYPAPTAP